MQTYKDSKDRARESKYKYALKCFDDGDYKNAVAAFSAIRDYEDVEERLPEAKYRYALALTAQSNWKEASDQFRILGDYKDSATKFQETYYKYGLLLINQKNYKSAINVFSELGDYQDSASRYKETYYQYGLQLLGSKSYKEAVTVFNSLGSYQESKAKLNEAKYGYVTAHKNRTDTTTYSYLKDLKAAGYKDSKDIYNSLYAWSVTIVINDSETNSTTSKSSISKYKTVYCHVTLHGGPPNEGIELRYSYNWPSSSTNGDSWDSKWYDGSSGAFCTWYTTPAYGYTGTFKARVYNKTTGELLGEATVTITN